MRYRIDAKEWFADSRFRELGKTSVTECRQVTVTDKVPGTTLGLDEATHQEVFGWAERLPNTAQCCNRHACTESM